MEKESTLVMVAELWKRRVEWLWERCEFQEPLDIEKLDEMIIESEEALMKAERHGKQRTEELNRK